MTEDIPEAGILDPIKMCLSSLPGLARVRHWSCPERLSSWSTEDLLLPQTSRSREAETWPGGRTPGLAMWEEKVLSIRGSRGNKHRELLMDKRREQEEELMMGGYPEQQEVKPITQESMEQRLLRVFLEADVELCKEHDDTVDGLGALCDNSEELEHVYDWFSGSTEIEDNCLHNTGVQSIHDSIQSSIQPCDLVIQEREEEEKNPSETDLVTDMVLTESDLWSQRRLDPGGDVIQRPKADINSEWDITSRNSCHSVSASQRRNIIATCSKTSSYTSLTSLVTWLLLIVTLSTPSSLSSRSLRGGGKRGWSSWWMFRPRRPPWLLVLSTWLLFYCPSVCGQLMISSSDNSICPDGVYRGNIDINNRDEDSKMSSLAKYVNCSVVEGSISITSALYNDQDINYSLPNLTEVTDFVLLYRADEIISFKDIFPRLAVIRGYKLVQFYALAIFQNARMVDIGLPSLTHIMNGGVRIEKNPSLCYVNSIDWTKIVQKEDEWKNIYLDENQDPNVCPAKCPEKCSGTENRCWNGEQCQRMLGICPQGTKFPQAKDRCYVDNNGQVGIPCHRECVGGCTDGNNADACFACNHTRHVGSITQPSTFTCRRVCPRGFVAYKQWTCIEELECSNTEILSQTITINSRDGDNNYKVEDDQCVAKCNPKNKAVKGDDNIWRCLPCKEKCPVVCIGVVVNSPKTAKKLRSCTDVRGDIIISVISAEITSILEENLQHIETIQGSLKIERSHSLVSLHFFKSLREIKGDNNAPDGKVLTIFENDNLQKLFPDNSVIKLGGENKNGYIINPIVFIHYNQKLCQKEITRFLDSSQVPSNLRDDHMVSRYTNGNKIVCSEEKLHIEVEIGGPMFFKVKFQNYQYRLETNTNSKDVDINALLGYHVYYRELTEQQYEEQNMSKFEGMDICGGSRWQVHFEEHTARKTGQRDPRDPNNGSACDETKERCMRDENGEVWAIITYPDISAYIANCKPYTPYAVYVTTVIEKSLAANATGAQSDIIYIRTLESKPTPVLGLASNSETNATTTSLEVKWRAPRNPYGIIEEYYVMLAYREFSKDVAERDYCNDKEKVLISGKDEPNEAKKPNEDIVIADNGTCPVCTTCGSQSSIQEHQTGKIAPDSAKVQDEQAFYNEIINKLFQIHTSPFEEGDDTHGMSISQRRRRDVSSGSSLNTLTTTEIPSLPSVLVQQNPDNEDKVNQKPMHPLRHLDIETLWMEVAGVQYINRTFLKVSGNTTQASIAGLIHYGHYEVRVFACQKRQTFSEPRGPVEYRVCSDEAILNTKTKHRAGVDNILPFDPQFSEYSLSTDTNNSVLAVRWRKPESPNGIVLHYSLHWGTSVEGPWSERCLSSSVITEKDGGILEYNLNIQGEYVIRLRAVSLFDDGQWTSMQWVKVASDRSKTIIAVIVVCSLAFIAAMAGASGFVYYRRQKESASGHWAYSTRNPDYVDTTDVYVVDDWEVDREDVTIGEELGKGSFGMVYKGTFDSKKGGELIHCAVKTVNEHAGLGQRIEFLQEASAMKDCRTEHVIKLIGVVSLSQPVLVLMELMENGDLKEFLRKRRPDEQNNRDEHLPVPQLRQILQMAADIADGMAYLGNKKMVHRDLAARNCMVSADMVVKVGDFGMARDVYETEYYRKEGRGFLPVRWMAPESIRDGKFTSQSDVWSYGVVLWEMATLAEVPYQGFANEQVMSYVKEGKKMPRPENCPDRLYDMMCECWESQPSSRPTFLDICRKLLNDASEEFSRSSFYLSSDGQEAVLNQEAMMQMRREQEEAQSTDPQTPLTAPSNGSHSLSPENGHLPASGDSLPMVTIRPGTSRSPTHVQFSNEQPGSRTSKLSMNGIIGGIQRLRNKSGSTSGEA